MTGTTDLDRRQDLAVLARSETRRALGTLLEVRRAGTYGVAPSVLKRPENAEDVAGSLRPVVRSGLAVLREDAVSTVGRVNDGS